MNILYFLEPTIELQNPLFRYGAFKNFVLRQSKNIKTENPSYQLYCVISSAVYKHVLANSLETSHLKLIIVDEVEWLSSYSGYYDLSYDLYNDKLPPVVVEKWESILSSKIDIDIEKIDLVLSWESPSAIQLNMIFSKAEHRYCMPGVMSRAPFAELTFVDPHGLFNKNSLFKFKNELLAYQATNDELKIPDYFRKKFCEEYFKIYCPVDIDEVKSSGGFDYLVLLPLQISGYFAFDHVCGFKNQLDFLESVISSVPENIGVIVTQYVTDNISDRAINDKTYAYLKDKYNNFISFKELDKIDGISQYLSSAVDGVICASSSIGIISSLWNKPLITVGDSHLSVFSDSNKVSDIEQLLKSNERGELKNKDNILSWMFTRLCHFTVEDIYNSNTTFKLLEKQLETPKLHSRIDSYPIVNDPNEFISKFERSSKFELAFNKLKMTNTNVNFSEKLSKLSAALNSFSDQNVSIISFDIFDTLLQRPFEKPVDLFELMRDRVLFITKGLLSNFKEVRVKAEGNAKKAYVSNEKEEILLVEIYNEIKVLTNIPADMLDEVMQLEIDLEIEFLKVRPSGKQLFDYAVSLGKKIIITSDMYLDKKTIQYLLEINGYSSYDNLYLSSDILLKKHTGSLYNYILQDLCVTPNSIVHVGDNRHGDINMAQKLGISTVFLPRAMETFYSIDPYKALYHKTLHSKPLSESVIIGLIANRLYEPAFNKVLKDSHFNKSAANLGYAGLGPLFFSFAKWIIEEAIQDKISDLYFLSRDGDIIQKVYEVLSTCYDNPPKAHYLLSSRRSARVSTLYNRQDIINLASTAIYNTRLNEIFESKMGISLSSDDLPVVQSVGFKSLDAKVSARDDKSKFTELALRLEAKILRNSGHERELYLCYLKDSGLIDAENPAVVDIGYAASMQKSISQLIDRKVTGYYFTTFTSARNIHKSGMPVKAFNGNFIDPKESHNPISNFGLAFETVFSNDQGSFVCMQRGALGKPIPKLENIIHESRKIQLVRTLHPAIIDFTKDIISTYDGVFQDLVFDADRSIKIYVDYLIKPSGRDAEIFEGVTFDDAFSGAGTRYMVPPRSWAPLNDEKLSLCVWKQGTQIFLRRPDITIKQTKTPQKNKVKARPSVKVNESNASLHDSKIVQPVKKTYVNFVLSKFIKAFWTPNQYQKFMRDPEAFYKDSKYLSWVIRK